MSIISKYNELNDFYNELKTNEKFLNSLKKDALEWKKYSEDFLDEIVWDVGCYHGEAGLLVMTYASNNVFILPNST